MSKSRKPERPIIYDLVKIDHQEVVTTSRIIAERFDRRHDNVLDAIRKIINGPDSSLKNKGSDRLTAEQKTLASSLRKDFAKNFRETTYIDDRGKERPMFLLNSEAARKVIMGFTGEKADVWQFLFIRAFSEMERELHRIRAAHASVEWRETRAIGKGARRELTDAIDDFVKYCVERNSKNAKRYFTTITLNIEKALYDPEDGEYKDIRDRLTPLQLQSLTTLELAAARRLRMAMDAGLPYKGEGGCFSAVMEVINRMAEDIGRTSVPPLQTLPELPGMEDAA